MQLVVSYHCSVKQQYPSAIELIWKDQEIYLVIITKIERWNRIIYLTTEKNKLNKLNKVDWMAWNSKKIYR